MFLLQSTHISGARRGSLKTAHGTVQTPFFMPIATMGAVRTLSAGDLDIIQKTVDPDSMPFVLSNTYHLYLRPGKEQLKSVGGLHHFMKWKHGMLTDSGGFQIFSLSHMNTIMDEGVEFQSHIDGSRHTITPEKSMEIQAAIGADIWMAFDYFPGYPAEKKEIDRSMRLTTAWADRCKQWMEHFRKEHPDREHQIFGIVQGANDPNMRKQSAQELQKIGFDGYAIGGLAVGEPAEIMYTVLDAVVPELPEEAPRYLMGVGPPEQILEAIKRGVDMFDCVIPTRNARHGSVFISTKEKFVDAEFTKVNYEKLNLKASSRTKEHGPIDSNCSCQVCTEGYSRAYIRHLFTLKEPLAARLATIHNVHFYMTFMKQIRDILGKV